MIELTPQEASARILAHLHEGRLVQRAWHGRDGEKQLACMIGALDPSINRASQCPASVMPQWLASLTVTLFEGQEKSDALAWAERSAKLMAGWSILTDENWKRIETHFKIATVKRAIAAAEPVAKDADYWPQVTAAAQQVCDALEGNGDRAAAEAAARAAEAAARAAVWAAEAAARAAAEAAARAAEAAARAAVWAAEAAADAAAEAAARAAVWAAEAAADAAARAAARAAVWAAEAAADAAARAAARAAEAAARAAEAAAGAAVYKNLADDLLTVIEAELAA
ncbi:MAG: hypothetical protein AB7J28_15820 [Hyphomonadaceae bacterium]